MDTHSVLVTGANGFLGSVVARAFRCAGWTTYGLVRDRSAVGTLERGEIVPIVADISDLRALDDARNIGFDIIVSNTEDHKDPAGHLSRVGVMLDHLTSGVQANSSRKPLVMFTSGSKDYGNMDEVSGDPELRPHTEESPIRPHPFAAARAEFSEELLTSRSDKYDAVILRPALMYGHAAGLFGLLFDYAESSEGVMTLKARPDTVMHAVHVEDCAAAYVALARHANRAALAGQAFNIANAKFETTAQVATALAQAYGRGLLFEEPDDDYSDFNAHLLANTSQWVGSAKIRDLTGWSDVMPSLSAGMSEYRMAYEAAKAGKQTVKR